MAEKRTSRKSHACYLTTAELLSITGITRKALRGYEANGIVTPVYEEDGYYKYWTLDQANELQFVQMLNKGGMPLKEIAGIVHDEVAMAEACYRQAMDEVRRARRRIKRLAHRRCMLHDYQSAPGTDGYYIRWLPQRWCALVPIYPSKMCVPSSDEYMLAHSLLRPIVDTVGWPRATTFGAIESIDGTNRSAMRYGYIDLANPVESTPVGLRPIDCGCYRVLDPENSTMACDGGKCHECARFGRAPSDAERAVWREYEEGLAAEGIDVQAHTVRSERLEKPYLSGAWSVYTKDLLGLLPDGMAGEVYGPTIRPRLMPHETLLPCGATVCVLPAGFYLCSQGDQYEIDAKFDEFTSLLERMETSPITEQDELAAWREAVEEAESFDEDELVEVETLRNLEHQTQPMTRSVDGFHLEPLAVPFTYNENLPMGWSRALDEDDLDKVVLKTRTALVSEEGYTFVCARTPFGKRADEIRHEMQVLVEAPELTAEARPVTSWVG